MIRMETIICNIGVVFIVVISISNTHVTLVSIKDIFIELYVQNVGLLRGNNYTFS